MRLGLLALALSVLAVGCSAPAHERTAGSAPASTAPTSVATGVGGHAQADATPTGPPTCARPPKALLDRVVDAVASHPGPVTRAASVFAATTSTGDWSVFAVERAYVRDDGSAAGGASRSLALVNASANDGGPQVIDIGLSQKSGGVEADWHRVSWSGTTLAAGRRAADLALGCLR